MARAAKYFQGKSLRKIYKYSYYRYYRMISTIQLSPETKRLISSFGTKGESFETIIKRMYNLAVKEQLKEFLLPSDRFIPLDEFEKEVNAEWPESR